MKLRAPQPTEHQEPNMVSFVAYGVPAPKGSTKAFMPKGGRFPVVTEDNEHTRPWAQTVKWAALKEVGGLFSLPFEEGPVALTVTFYMPRPKSLPKKQLYHVKKPDLDKLVRCVKDALTGIVWRDDSQVVTLSASKHYALEMPRAMICVERV